MAGDVILVWQGGRSTVLSGGKFFHGVDKPPLSFSFDSLICETPGNLYFRIVGEVQHLLTEEQVEECRAYADGFVERGEYAVFAYDPLDENVYKGHMAKSKAQGLGFSWTIDSRPDHDASAWNGSGWTRFHAAFTSSGELRTDIPGICGDFGVLLTKEQYEALPAQPSPFHVWDFVRDEWKDGRDLEKVRKESLLSLRHHFEAVRWKSFGNYVPPYEMASWRFQLEEAEAFLEGRDADTPYLDAFFAESPRDRREHCERIVRNSRRFAEAMGRANGIQTRFWDELMRGGSIAECEEILRRAEKFISDEMGVRP